MREILQDGTIKLVLNQTLFSREAVLKAAYWATRDAFVSVAPDGDDHSLVVTVRSKAGDGPSLGNPRPVSSAQLADQFENSLVDFQLREEIQSQTATIREIILTKAFAESGVFEEDPVGTPFDSVSEPSAEESLSNPLKILSS